MINSFLFERIFWHSGLPTNLSWNFRVEFFLSLIELIKDTCPSLYIFRICVSFLFLSGLLNDSDVIYGTNQIVIMGFSWRRYFCEKNVRNRCADQTCKLFGSSKQRNSKKAHHIKFSQKIKQIISHQLLSKWEFY